MATIGQVAVIVAQEGADAAGPFAALDAAYATVVLLDQQPHESLSQLSQRVRARVSTLLREGYRIQSATFVAKNGFDLADVLPTADLLRALVTTMVAVGSGCVYLHADSRDTRAHLALSALADAIAEQVRGTGVQIVKGAPRMPAGAGVIATAV
jgi:hypothetical protein